MKTVPVPEIQLVPIPTRHPLQLFIFTLCIITGLPVLLGDTPAPGSIEATLPPTLVTGWSWVLVLGAVVVIVGMAWKDRISGMGIEQVGLVAVGFAAAFYGAVLTYRAYSDNPAGVLPGVIILGFGLSCLVRWRQLQSSIKNYIRFIEAVKAAAALREDS